MNENLKQIISAQLDDRELLQYEVAAVLGAVVERLIEAGTVYKNSREYRFGSDPVNADMAVKRMVNNIAPVLRSSGGYRAGLVDTTKENLKKQRGILVSQIRLFLEEHLESKTADVVALNIADAILISWILVPQKTG